MNTSRIKMMLSCMLSGCVAVIAVVAWAQNSARILLIDQPVDHDAYAARSEVDLRATVDGDFVAAGQRVTVDGAVTGDVIVAAQDIEIRSPVGDDLRAAGQRVRVLSPVAGHIVAAGQTVTIGQTVGDWVWLAGGAVEVLANVGGNLKIRAQNITINAKIDGNVDLIGGELRLGPKAIVLGDLRWRSENEADISSEARIDGEFVAEPLPDYFDENDTGGGLFFTLSIIVAVMVLFLMFSRQLRATAARIGTHPAMSLILGLAVLIGMPLLAIVLFATAIGVWLGLAVLGIYLVVLLVGVLIGLYALSDLTLRRFRPNPAMWQALAAIFVAVVAVGLLTFVPLLGFVAVLAIWLLGVGALCWTLWGALRNHGQTPIPM